MYTKYWNLAKRPFEIGPEPAFYYPAQGHQAVLLKLRYILETRHGSALLTGPAGVGKTLLTLLLDDLRRKGSRLGPVWSVPILPFDAENLLLLAAEKIVGENGFGHSEEETGADENSSTLYRAFTSVERTLHRLSLEKRRPVLVLEGVHTVRDPNIWPLLDALTSIRTHDGTGLAVLLTGTPDFQAEEIGPFAEMLETRAVLAPLAVEESVAYVHFRLQRAGTDREIFTPAALETVHHLTGGIPRKINKICDLALLIGYAEKLPAIDDALVETLNRELIASG